MDVSLANKNWIFVSKKPPFFTKNNGILYFFQLFVVQQRKLLTLLSPSKFTRDITFRPIAIGLKYKIYLEFHACLLFFFWWTQFLLEVLEHLTLTLAWILLGTHKLLHIPQIIWMHVSKFSTNPLAPRWATSWPESDFWCAQELFGEPKIVGPKAVHSTMLVGSQLCDFLFVGPGTHWLLLGGSQIKQHQEQWALAKNLTLR